MCKFKKGDKIRYIESRKGKEIFTVDRIEGTCGTGWMVWLTSGTWVSSHEVVLVTSAYPNPPHKHAEVIKAWADGADIQFLNLDRNWRNVTPTSVNPISHPLRDFRIKPEKTEKEIQIEKLEKQARELADEIAKLKEEV